MLIVLLRWLTDPVLADSMAGDLAAERHRRARTSPFRAALWFYRAAIGLVIGLLLQRLRGPWRLGLTEGVWRDVVFGARLMRRQPLATSAAVLALSLSIGLNVAMIAVVRAVLFSLPFQDVDRVVRIEWTWDGRQPPRVTASELRGWQSVRSGFESIAGEWGFRGTLTGSGGAEAASIECVSADMFRVLGVSPLAGRTFLETEDRPGAEPVVVLSHRFWVRRLGADPAVVGRTLVIDDRPVTVIGVMRAGFTGPLARGDTDAWMPLEPYVATQRSPRNPDPSIVVFAKLRAGVRAEAAVVSLNAAAPPDAGGVNGTKAPHLLTIPITEQVTGEARAPLLILTAATGLVLLIACANVSGLLLARTNSRRRELAVRLAMGGSRGRIARQLATESVMLGLAGGLLGAGLSFVAVNAIVGLIPRWVPRVEEIGIDWRVLGACVVVSLGAGLLFGLLPALHGARSAPSGVLGDRSDAQSPSRGRARTALIVTEVALALALLVGSGLLTRAFLHMRPDHPGFDPSGKIVAMIDLPRKRYPQDEARATFYDELARRLADQPGIHALSAASSVPLSGMAELGKAAVDGASAPVSVFVPVVTPNYFSEMGIPVLRGRGFTRDDGPASPPVAVVNEMLVRRLFAGADPLGARLSCTDGFGGQTVRTIVGVVRDTRLLANQLEGRPEVFAPIAQSPTWSRVLILRTDRPVEETAALVRREVATLDTRIVIGSVESMTATVDRQVSGWRFIAWLMDAFAGLALVLAAVGVFAIVAWTVTERTWEIGVRLALGATHASVLRSVMSRTFWMTSAGVVLGLALALATTRLLSDWLADVSPFDVRTFVAAVGVMLVVAAAASYIPSRRALRVDPVQTLKA